MVKVDPTPTSDHTVHSPPWFWLTCLTIARPRPVPPVTRERAGIEHLPKEIRPFLRKTGVTFGALDIFAPALLKPAPRQLLAALGTDRRPLEDAMLPVIAAELNILSGK